MGTPNPKAIQEGEKLLRRLRTWQLSGFVAVATDEHDVASYSLAGRLNLTQSVCLLEHLRLLCLAEWTELAFSTVSGPMIEVVDETGDDDDGS